MADETNPRIALLEETLERAQTRLTSAQAQQQAAADRVAQLQTQITGLEADLAREREAAATPPAPPELPPTDG